MHGAKDIAGKRRFEPARLVAAEHRALDAKPLESLGFAYMFLQPTFR